LRDLPERRKLREPQRAVTTDEVNGAMQTGNPVGQFGACPNVADVGYALGDAAGPLSD